MKFKILFIFTLFQLNIAFDNISWNQSDEESLFRQTEILQSDQFLDDDLCQKNFNFNDNHAMVSKYIYMFDPDYFVNLNLNQFVLIYFRKYNTPYAQLFKYKNDYFLRNHQCLFPNDNIKKSQDIFLQDAGSGFSKINHEKINQSGFTSDVFFKEKYVQEILQNNACLGYQDDEFNNKLLVAEFQESIVQYNGKFYYASSANFYEQDFLKISLGVEYQKNYVAQRYTILQQQATPCAHAFQHDLIQEEQKDALYKSYTNFPVIPLKAFVLVQLDISEEVVKQNRLKNLITYFMESRYERDSSILIKVLNQLYFKQAQAAIYMGLNVTCGLYRRCFIDAETTQIYHFFAQPIEGDAREVSKFVYSPIIKMYLNELVSFAQDQENLFIGPLLPGQHFHQFQITEINQLLQPINEFLAKYFLFGGYILKSFEKIDSLLQDENWIQFNKMLYKLLQFIIKSKDDQIYVEQAKKMMVEFTSYITYQIELMEKVLEIRKFNKQQIIKQQNQELGKIIVEIYKKILRILELNKKVKNLNKIDKNLSNNLNYLIQKEIQLDESKIDHKQIQEQLKKYMKINLQSNLQKSLQDLLEDLSYSIDERKKKDILQNNIGIVQDLDNVYNKEFQDKKLKKQQEDKKKGKEQIQKADKLELQRTKKELNLFLYKKGLIKDLPENFKQTTYQTINKDLKRKKANKKEQSKNSTIRLCLSLIVLMFYQLILFYFKITKFLKFFFFIFLDIIFLLLISTNQKTFKKYSNITFIIFIHYQHQ